MSSDGSPDIDVASVCGDAEMCAGRSRAYFVPFGLRGFFVAVARRGVWRLLVFFVIAGASNSGEG